MPSRLVFFVVALALVGCSSAQKQRKEEREKLSAHAGLYCDFVNGDEYQDAEVQLNLEMARRCDPNKNFTLTDYKNASELHGIVYCCAMARKAAPAAAPHDGDEAEKRAESRKVEAAKAPAPKPAAPVAAKAPEVKAADAKDTKDVKPAAPEAAKAPDVKPATAKPADNILDD